MFDDETPQERAERLRSEELLQLEEEARLRAEEQANQVNQARLRAEERARLRAERARLEEQARMEEQARLEEEERLRVQELARRFDAESEEALDRDNIFRKIDEAIAGEGVDWLTEATMQDAPADPKKKRSVSEREQLEKEAIHYQDETAFLFILNQLPLAVRDSMGAERTKQEQWDVLNRYLNARMALLPELQQVQIKSQPTEMEKFEKLKQLLGAYYANKGPHGDY